MKFGIAISGNITQEQTQMIVNLDDNVNFALETKNYGTSVESLLIGFICVAPQFDSFFKKGKRKYTSGSKTTIQHGLSITVTNQFEYDVKFDYESFAKSSVEKARELLIAELESSLTNFDAYKKKFKDFDLDSFKKDFLDILKSLRSTLVEVNQDNPIINSEKSTPMTNLGSALEQFKECSVKHVATIGFTVPGAAVDSYQKLLEAVDYLKAHDAIEELEKFNNHPESAVQLMAASFLLPTKAQLAGEILNRISKLDSKESFIAKMLLQDLKSGNL